MKAKKSTSFKPRTTDSVHNNVISPRVFKTEETRATRSNQFWSTDITYLPMGGSFLYLVVFLDLYSRKIVSWSLSPSLSKDFVLDAFLKATRTRSVPPGLVIHSDRGVQYTCKKFRQILKQLGIVQSMSRKGNCYDNAHCESFFSQLKKEVEFKRLSCYKEVEMAIFEWIDGFYNTQRLHSSLGYQSPINFEKNEVEKDCCVL